MEVYHGALINEQDVVTADFSTIKADANLKEAFEGIKKTLEGSSHSPGLIVVENQGKYAGVLSVGLWEKGKSVKS